MKDDNYYHIVYDSIVDTPITTISLFDMLCYILSRRYGVNAKVLVVEFQDIADNTNEFYQLLKKLNRNAQVTIDKLERRIGADFIFIDLNRAGKDLYNEIIENMLKISMLSLSIWENNALVHVGTGVVLN